MLILVKYGDGSVDARVKSEESEMWRELLKIPFVPGGKSGKCQVFEGNFSYFSVGFRNDVKKMEKLKKSWTDKKKNKPSEHTI